MMKKFAGKAGGADKGEKGKRLKGEKGERRIMQTSPFLALPPIPF
ncbi:MAG: hypothetical protein AB1491_10975 [Thermodesulfobacteriota bacterium]